MLEQIKATYEYDLIQEFYGKQKAKRSKVPYMNHIDEGIIVIDQLGNTMGSENMFTLAALAFCLHPIVQSDKDLEESFKEDLLTNVDVETVMLAMEYRSVANEYLSKRVISDVSEIRLSPILPVNVMLVADKVQNRKDFELYHKGKHERSAELDQYFKNWLQRLGISEGWYQELKAVLLKHNGLVRK